MDTKYQDSIISKLEYYDYSVQTSIFDDKPEQYYNNYSDQMSDIMTFCFIICYNRTKKNIDSGHYKPIILEIIVIYCLSKHIRNYFINDISI